MRHGVITIAFGIDAEYVAHAASTITSILRHLRGHSLHILILHDGIPQERRLQLEAAAPAATFRWVEITDESLLGLKAKEHVGRATFFRFALPDIASDLDRIIYLDADMTVIADLAELWQTDLEGRTLGAVDDPGIDAAAFASTWGLDAAKAAYFNAGVLLIDLAQARRDRSFERARDLMIRHGADFPYTDQDALNIALWGVWHLLDWTWNVQRVMALEGHGLSQRRPAIVHYTSAHKPWLPHAYQPYGWLYWRYLKRPFKQEIIRKHGVGLLERARHCLRWLRRARAFSMS